ncbi:MAG: 1-acyl-sn-glycerol-3-phosphate acyltransferase [Crocinitomicaceae bacterium]|nr:1-acyl-sn-glycerol-3-phosphate acyltransferase [Crocinitomicaceae bacterium]NGF74963.1 glycerol acyltransferase [Fluviicola sp. SGL-29]
MSEDNFIDIRKLVQSKSPKLAKLIPGFIYRYLKRILHQDEINDFMRRNGHLKNEAFCNVIVEEFDLRVEMKGMDHIPAEGGVILVMNHPLGGMDAMALVHALGTKRTDIKFIVNDLLLNLAPLKELFVGVNKHGSNERQLHMQMTELFSSDAAIGIFPAGLVSRRKNGKIADLEWKKTFVRYARRNNKTIIPIYIEGRLSSFFYNLSNFRRFIGIKANIEMLYLSDELYKQKGKRIQFTVGKPIQPDELKNGKSDEEVAQDIKATVYELKEQRR